MNEKWHTSEKVAIYSLVVAVVIGFIVGFFFLAPGWYDHERLEKSLNNLSLYEPIEIPRTARADFGKMAEKVYEDYLRLYQKEASALIEYNQILENALDSGRDLSKTEIESLTSQNKSSYEHLKELIENDEKYIRNYVVKYDKLYDDEESLNSLIEILQTVCYREEFEEKISTIYFENVSILNGEK